MPQHPRTSSSVTEIRGSVFTALAAKLRAFPGEVFPFHVGDTWLSPPEGSRMEDLSEATHPGMHRYSQPEGLPILVDSLVERVAERSGIETTRKSILVATGATGALGAIVGALVEPGDEVLLLSPYWPLIEGIVRSFHGVPTDAPFLDLDDAGQLEARLEGLRSERTVAIYLNSPNNPTGRLLPREWLESIAAWAVRHGLWIIADEVYEELVYSGEHTYCRSLAPDHTFSAHSFSKGWGMAGNRCGWVVGPDRHMDELRKVGTHSFYAAPTASQLAAHRLLSSERAREWLAEAVSLYRDLGAYAADRLGVEAPEGSTFLFVDVAPHLGEGGLEAFLLECADRGIFLAPGPSFGPFPSHVRLCFTAAPPEVTRRGVEVMRELLGL